MRPLADWLHERVRYQGTITERKQLQHGDYRYLMERVLVRRYRGGETRHLDHLWFIRTPEQAARCGNRMREVYCGVGDVIRYRRAWAQTDDYGVRSCTECVDPEIMNRDAEEAWFEQPEKSVKILRYALQHFESGTAVLAIEADHDAIIKTFRHNLEDVERLIEARRPYRERQKQQLEQRARLTRDLRLPRLEREKTAGFGMSRSR